ncbi:EAL domain-containing protein [Parafannyhessea umbonata]|uniref:PAS domain S-box-containing protein/diguanylate cyclase (GGDEF) domain-containing protein n=1 Tax=Parafannyhessea umbonata TaxID=604330 RepID=A0A1H9PJF6_9ACTN|nr:EAL domain-containing protein [Parafannyhessea umbonata]SER47693.1 PAS domain S-box-containing protein/diguanylate cyclase (GGDEF) domain-containing protein [Parafannyhessea umbonata]
MKKNTHPDKTAASPSDGAPFVGPGEARRINPDPNGMPGGFFVYQAEGEKRVVYANDYVLKLFGCEDEREFAGLTGNTFPGMVHEDDLATVEGDIANQIRAGQGGFNHVTYRIRTKSGEVTYVENFGRLVHDADEGDLFYVFLADSKIRFLTHTKDRVTKLLGMQRFLELAHDAHEATLLVGRQQDSDTMAHSKPRAIRSLSGPTPQFFGGPKRDSPTGEAIAFFNLVNFKLYNSIYGIKAGDECLFTVAQTLREEFADGSLVSRFSDDHFAVYTKGDRLQVEAATERVHKRVASSYKSFSLQVKAGIYLLTSDRNVSISEASDLARMACNSIKADPLRHVLTYGPELKRITELRKHLVENLESAIETGLIEVHYQPQIRTLSGKLCGVEALTRWRDPEFGLITPDTFVPVLEEANLSYKLDTFVIRHVCQSLRRHLDEGREPVAVSFNLSRVDFISCDPLEVLEDAVRTYGVPRDMLHAEVTESIAMRDETRIKVAIERFHEMGYQIWMDDFGSGYSSLNVLKDYDFDVIKIDMAFLSNLSARARQILTSTVDMAKRLGIQTLAEGVETEEQLAFLRSIGCEKIQGYFYGRPLLPDRLDQHLRNLGMIHETGAESHFWDKVGTINQITDQSLAIVDDDGRHFKIIFANEGFLEALRSKGTDSIAKANENLSSPYYLNRVKFREFSQRPIATHREETFNYVDNGNYLRLNIRVIATLGERRVYRCSLYNITYDTNQRESSRMDLAIRNISSLYDSILEIDFEADCVTTIVSNLAKDSPGERRHGIIRLAEDYSHSFIHPDDREAYWKFMAPGTMAERVAFANAGFTSAVFRVRGTGGSWRWREFVLIPLPNTGNLRYLYAIRLAALEFQSHPGEALERLSADYSPTSGLSTDSIRTESIWGTLIESSGLKFFWKDDRRRFQGASWSFLHYFGLKTVNEILNKTDEEMFWHVADAPFHSDEDAVLLRGEVVRGAHGQCIARGVLRDIVAYKYPIHERGRIVGLVGFFVEAGELADKSHAKNLLIDKVTGGMNDNGIATTIVRMDEEFHREGIDYSIVVLDVPEYSRIYHTYGEKVAQTLLREVHHAIEGSSPRSSTIGRLTGGKFVVMFKGTAREAEDGVVDGMLAAVHAIHRVDGYPCTVFANYALIKGSEARSLKELEHIAVDRLSRAKDLELVRRSFTGDILTVEMSKLDTLEAALYICDAKSYEIVFANEFARREFGIERSTPLRGLKCYKVFGGSKDICHFCSSPSLSRKRFHHSHLHNHQTGKDYTTFETLMPWNGKPYRVTLALCTSDLVAEAERRASLLYVEHSINDMLSVALSEPDPNDGLDRMLEMLGDLSDARHAFIFEDDEMGLTSNTYEWCAAGQPSRISEFQQVRFGFSDSWTALLSDGGLIVIEDPAHDERLSDKAREELVSQRVDNLVAARLFQDARPIGFLGIEGVAAGKIEVTELFMRIAAAFTSILLRNRNTMERLNSISTHDPLTGTMNRRAFTTFMRGLTVAGGFALVYGDLNGLKETNDVLGHDAGDALIERAARVLEKRFGTEFVFRMGGDEFVAYVEMSGPDKVDALLASLRQEFRERGVSIALGCVWKGSYDGDYEGLISEADRRMYLDKRYIHEHEPTGILPILSPEDADARAAGNAATIGKGVTTSGSDLPGEPCGEGTPSDEGRNDQAADKGV